LLTPIWRESADGKFVLEAVRDAKIRNKVPGIVEDVYAREGMLVTAGAPLFKLRSTALQSKAAEKETDVTVASVQANAAALQYANLGPALEEREQLARQSKEMKLQTESLQLDSPIQGTVLTARVEDRLGTYVQAGSELVEVADLGELRARVYVMDSDLYKVRLGAWARLNVEGFSEMWRARAAAIAPVSSGIDPSIAEQIKYRGLNPQNFYIVDFLMANRHDVLRPGMVGMARIYGPRRSLLRHAAGEIARFFGRKAW